MDRPARSAVMPGEGPSVSLGGLGVVFKIDGLEPGKYTLSAVTADGNLSGPSVEVTAPAANIVLTALQTSTGLALGGTAGARHLARQGAAGSRNTLLRRVRQVHLSR